MLEGPPEVLVREYRGYRYVAEDLFADDAEWLAEDGWHVGATEWELEHGGQLGAWWVALSILLRGPYSMRSREEYVLRVAYHRGPDWDSPDAVDGAQ